MKDIRTKNEGDLRKLITEQREALRAFRFAGEGSRTRNVRAARGMRKIIARSLTELASRKENA